MIRNSMISCGLPSIFINAECNTDEDLQKVARSFYRVVFICVESVETPRFARVLYSKTFQAALQAIYIDEAHLVHESLDWRPGYQRLAKLRTAVGEHIPLVAISATLPSSYRDALCVHAGLRRRHLLINLGNFRPELSLVVQPLRHAGSFQDLAFTLPASATASTILPTLVYHDNVVKLTDMLWWYTYRLRAAGLPDTLAGIVHSGLSVPHQEAALKEFRDGRTKILLATEKIGAGIHLPNVQRVVQYLARNNLTLAKLDQRRGRGARTKGMTATCYFIVERELIDSSEDAPYGMDPGVLALIRAGGCYQYVLDKWLENPLRQRPFTRDAAARLCCSYCQPALAAAHEYEWVMVDPSAQVHRTSAILQQEERDNVLVALRALRLAAWREEWRTEWRSFGPDTLIADADLEAVAKVAPSIESLDDLRPLTRIPYWDNFAPWLLSAVKDTVLKLNLSQVSEEVGVDEDQTAQVPQAGHETSSVPSARKSKRRPRPANPRAGMHEAEVLIEFQT